MRRNNRNTEPSSPLAAMLTGIPPMAIFGILFTAIGAVNAYNTYKKVKENSKKPHEHQEFDEEPVFEKTRAQKEELRCPYCGKSVAPLKFVGSPRLACPRCGRIYRYEE